MNLSTVLDDAAARGGSARALTVNDRDRTFSDVADLSRRGARILAGTGAGHVVYLAVTGPAYPLTLMAAVRAGLPFTPLNYRLAPDQISQLVRRFDDPIVVVDPACAAAVEGFRRMTVDEFLTGVDEDPTATVELPDPAADSVAVVLFTSGTTAQPKAVLLRHNTLVPYIARSAQTLVTEPGDTSLISVPPYHVMGVTGVLNAYAAGRRMVFLPTFSAAGWLDLARTERVTSATVVPTMLARIVRHLDGRPADLPALRAIVYGGSQMPRSVLELALAAFPTTDFANGYGLTETNAGITALPPEEIRAALASPDPAVRARLGSAGRPAPGVELQVRGADGSVLDPGQLGELWVKGPQVAGEYAGLGSVLDASGWFPTRDLAHIDDEGFLFIHGRVDDTIIRGGENIAPAEIEDVLDAHPGVHAVAVVGLPDDEWGQRIVAVVVARPGTSAAELTAFVKERLRGSRTPDEIIFRDDLPYTDSGKILRKVLVAQLVESRVDSPL